MLFTKENRRKVMNLKKNKGVTLVALVVTIIAITILVGVVINITTGENGILEKAVTSTSNYTKSEEKNITLYHNMYMMKKN